MGDRTTTMRAQAIETFAATLADLRESVGRPSFREMAGRSQAISHTTLHEAVHGNRLPSWATTAEFVKACGADPRLYRDSWDQANRAVVAVTHGVCRPVPPPASNDVVRNPLRNAGVPSTSPVGEPVTRDAAAAGRAAGEPAAFEPGTPPASTAPSSSSRARPRWRTDRRALCGAAALVVALGASLGFIWSDRGEPDPGPAAAPGPIAADCPVHQHNPPAAPPAHEGDKATFVADVTLNDCSHVQGGQSLPKVWRLKNAGSVPWVGYSLHRIDLPQQRGQCQTISDVPVPDTAPGQAVDVEVAVSLPRTPTFCLVRFKLLDAGGEVAFPGNRPVNFQVIVDPPRGQASPVASAG